MHRAMLSLWVSPKKPKESMRTVPIKSFQKPSANLATRGLDDQVELNHLERHGDGPVNVAVDNGAGVHGNPVLTHVHVVDSCNQGDQCSAVDRSLPVTNDGARLREQEDRCCNHCDGDDPE